MANESFVTKLISVTKSGHFDYCWKYNYGSDTYMLNLPKHYLNGLRFSPGDEKKTIIFPNGYGLQINDINQLVIVVSESLKRTMQDSIKTFVSDKRATNDNIKNEQKKDNNENPEQ